MPISTIDSKPALVVVDLQKGLLGRPTVHPMEDVVANSAKLAAAFREREFPVVLVTATGGAPGRTEGPARGLTDLPDDFADLLPELDTQPGDVLVQKQTWGAFTGTSLHETLQGFGVTQILVTGIATQFGVESTARSAHEHGYHVVFVTDAMTTMDLASHEHAVQHIFPRIGETGTTGDVLTLLSKA